MALGYDDYNATLEAAYDKYETQFGIEFEMTAEEFEAITPEQKALYDQAYDALCKDEQAMLVTVAGILVVMLMLVEEIGALLESVQSVFGF